MVVFKSKVSVAERKMNSRKGIFRRHQVYRRSLKVYDHVAYVTWLSMLATEGLRIPPGYARDVDDKR